MSFVRADRRNRRWSKAFAGQIAGLVAGVLIAIPSVVVPASADPTHGLSAFGDLKYPAGFAHFDYVNPDAPKSGKVAHIGSAGVTTFDSFNDFILKGEAAQGLNLLYDSLMVRAFDEPDAVYGLVAESADVAADGLSATFRLRPEARFADGTPVTADDCVFTLESLKSDAAHPRFSLTLRDVVKAEALDPATVRYTFQGTLIRKLPLVVAELPILPRAYYQKQPFTESSLAAPLGSGPYAISDHVQGRFVTYKRRTDYWAKDLNVNRGRNNFDEVRFDYFRDRALELEALLAGTIQFREEFTSKDWATGYDKPVVKSGRIKLMTLPDERPSGAQGFFINTRRPAFKDVRVRRALDLAFDFEWSNRNLFFGLYKRTASFFENSPMKAVGPPSPEELELLEPWRSKLPPEVFGEPYSPPVTDGSGLPRENFRTATKLLVEAGWKIDPSARLFKNAAGETLKVEILLDSPSFERIAGPYVKNLRTIGIDATMRRVESAEYERRLKTFDFDLTTERYALSLTPGNEVRNFWGSEAAKIDGSYNLAGISDPAVDALADAIAKAETRPKLVTAARALDRVLRAGHYWVPHWYKAAHNLAFWDRFGWPETKPKYERGALDTWWYDGVKAAKTGAN
ncbi:MAG: extracellular solute-binding protein [Hyphomicrobium sp.]|nr:extracellular solute-binding protein [Hyphomicrobium sp.]